MPPFRLQTDRNCCGQSARLRLALRLVCKVSCQLSKDICSYAEDNCIFPMLSAMVVHMEAARKGKYRCLLGESMNKTQAVLFRLMVDFDAICLEHGIEYILIGGSQLGAVRHRGFIPWDDDVDILVSREQFQKLDEVLTNLNRSDRVWVTEDNTPSFHNPLGKWFDATTTNLFRSLLLDGSPNSSHLEIFIADPYPADEEKQVLHNKYLWLYTELQNPYFPSANIGMPDGMFDMELLEHYQAEVEKRGLADVMREIRSKLDHPDDECDSICQRWSYRPVVFRSEWLEDKTRVPFETASFPVGKDVVRRLMVNFDENWYLLPPKSHREIHASFENTKMPYAEHAEELLGMCDEMDYGQKLYQNKVDRRERTAQYDKLDRNAAQYKRAFLAALAKLLAKRTWTFDPSKTSEFSSVFKEYFAVQFHPRYRKFRLAAPVEDGLLECMLYTLIYESRIKDTRDLVSLYPAFAEAGKINAICDCLWELKVARYSGDESGVHHYLDVLRNEHGLDSQIDVERASMWLTIREDAELSAAEIQGRAAELEHSDDYEIEKFVGDAYARQGDIVTAQRLYKDTLRSGTHGVLVQELADAGYYNGKSLERTTQEVLKLLSEIDVACEALGIDYLTSGLVPKILFRKRFENFYDAQVYVKAEDLPILLAALMPDAGNEYRALEYIGNNPHYPFLGFTYLSKGSVRFKTDEVLPLNYKGVRVDVLAIRNAKASLPKKASVWESAMSLNYRPFATEIEKTCTSLKMNGIRIAKLALEKSSASKRDEFFKELCAHYAVGTSKSLRVRDAVFGYAYLKIPYKLLRKTQRASLFGYRFMVPVNLASFRKVLYPIVDGKRVFPTYGTIRDVYNCDVDFDALKSANPDLEAHLSAAATNRERAEAIRAGVEERVRVIEGVWESAQELFSDGEDKDE